MDLRVGQSPCSLNQCGIAIAFADEELSHTLDLGRSFQPVVYTGEAVLARIEADTGLAL